ncbi:ATPase, T2SS/T4P/T4SS family [Bulleidia sp. zg-1006]|uniref:ATPase, T2SS/T4P/T4SS family n=2 Tax=Bacteria TaxID=2 RepID=UPI00193ADA10|nr:ATPase, T2SS/T4P/T4SS family [Bulleidia sp. zg-1006]QRG86026.1 Flp pilus assembly complex ATPase component TadA [Bulleidia sp. zg-1006]
MDMKARLKDWLKEALLRKASDIHFIKQDGKAIQMEFRTMQGIEMVSTKPEDERLFHYLMYLANLDVSRAYLPQSGSFEIQIGEQSLSCRFALIQSHHQQSAVLRILNHNHHFQIEELTTSKNNRDWMRRMMAMKSGFVLFSGLTGSGKTTTMYSILQQIQGKKIFSLEDPIEVYQENMVQLQVSKEQLSYEEGIKQLLRHDPDIILIGEIRDSVAAKMAYRCALTGHLVFSSIHASSSILAIRRMVDLGVPLGRLKEVLVGISYQELVEEDGHKQSIYEVMDEKELSYYFQNQKHSPEFVPLEKQLSQEIYFF